VFYVGDLHGELKSARFVKDIIRKYPKHSVVFLGDYGDRGPEQVETFNLVMALTLENPERVHMLRGNHESDSIANRYGFYMDVSRKHSHRTFQQYSKVFEALPLAGLSENGIFSCHGGIPEGVKMLEDLQRPNRHDVNFPEDIPFQLVWNDPYDRDFDFRPNSRSQRARIYGRRAFDAFSVNLGVKLIFRGHQVYSDGIKTFFDGQVISVFSATYKGRVSPKVVRLGKDFKYEPIPIET
ncbi:MAG: metallophosphoesterase, partial [Candidatus Hodarchaeales archaeon]